jgi:hypothetical protein
LLLRNYLPLKMLTETLLRIPFSVIGRRSLGRPLIGRKNAQELTGHGGFQCNFTESQAAFCNHFQCQIAALGSLKRVTGRVFKFENNFNGAG